jgi:hypothetical protein
MRKLEVNKVWDTDTTARTALTNLLENSRTKVKSEI